MPLFLTAFPSLTPTPQSPTHLLPDVTLLCPPPSQPSLPRPHSPFLTHLLLQSHPPKTSTSLTCSLMSACSLHSSTSFFNSISTSAALQTQQQQHQRYTLPRGVAFCKRPVPLHLLPPCPSPHIHPPLSPTPNLSDTLQETADCCCFPTLFHTSPLTHLNSRNLSGPPTHAPHIPPSPTLSGTSSCSNTLPFAAPPHTSSHTPVVPSPLSLPVRYVQLL